MRAAVVANPTKHDQPEKLRGAIRAAMSEHGWSEPLWLETTIEDPGEGQAREAVQAGVDLVLACGGDGTVTACAAGVAASGVPLAVLPAGTDNLLARNLGLPLDLSDALSIALTGTDRKLDMGVANDRPFIVMAGIPTRSQTTESWTLWCSARMTGSAGSRSPPMCCGGMTAAG